jgi:hypothetical protein
MPNSILNDKDKHIKTLTEESVKALDHDIKSWQMMANEPMSGTSVDYQLCVYSEAKNSHHPTSEQYLDSCPYCPLYIFGEGCLNHEYRSWAALQDMNDNERLGAIMAEMKYLLKIRKQLLIYLSIYLKEESVGNPDLNPNNIDMFLKTRYFAARTPLINMVLFSETFGLGSEKIEVNGYVGPCGCRVWQYKTSGNQKGVGWMGCGEIAHDKYLQDRYGEYMD